MPDTDVTYGSYMSYTNFSGISLPNYGDHGQTFLKPLLKIGDSTNRVTMTTAGIPLMQIYSTSADTSGTSVNYILCEHNATAAGGTGHRALFHTTATAKLGGWANALRAYFEFGASGDITGLASGACIEVKMPNASITGNVCVLELELVDQASTGYGSGGSFIRAAVSGTATGFDTAGYFLDLQGFTPGDGKVIDSSVAAATGDGGIRIRIGASDKWLLYADDNT